MWPEKAAVNEERPESGVTRTFIGDLGNDTAAELVRGHLH